MVCQELRKSLNLGDYKAYINNLRETSISTLEKKSLINIVFLWLASSICMATSFEQTLMDLLELQFVLSSDLFDKSHSCAYVCKLIALSKTFDIFLKAYFLDTLSSPIFTIEVVNKIAHYYSCLSLAQANDFHKIWVKHKIACLDIIIAQTANRTFAFKAILGCI